MSPATEWSLVVLQSMRGRLSSLARRGARLKARSVPGDDQRRRTDAANHFFDAVLDALDVFNNEHRVVFKRLKRLEEEALGASAPQARQGNDALGPLFDALESINGKLTGFAARLARLEDAAFQVQPPRCLRPARSSPAAATVRARSRRMRKAVSHA